MKANRDHTCCDFPEQFKRTEKRIKFIAIPVLGLLSGFVFSPEDCYTITRMPIAIADSILVIYAVWLSLRFIIVQMQSRFYHALSNARRLTIQLSISLVISFIIITLNNIFLHNLFDNYGSWYDLTLKHKALYLTMLSFVIMINSIYENFYLFSKLNQAMVSEEKYRKHSVSAELQNLKSKINPHFLFNTFNALSEIIEEEPKRASHLVHELSDVYRYVLQTQDENWVPLRDEFEFASSFAQLLKMRYEQNLQVDITLSEECKKCKILPLSLQLLIENAIKHNEISTKHPLRIEVYTENEEFLVVKNKKMPRKTLPSSTKTGLDNINKRYKHLAEKEIIIDDSNGWFTVKLPLMS